MIHINELPDWWPQVVGLDIETKASERPDPFNFDIATIQVSGLDGDTYLFTNGFRLLAPMLEDPAILKVIHNANYDMRYLVHQLSCSVQNVWDSFLAERILTAGTGLRCDLASTVWRRAEKLLEKDDKTSKSFVPGKELTERQLRYVENDVKYLLQVRDAQKVQISKDSLGVIAELEHDLLPVIVNMGLRGVCLDTAAWDEVAQEELRLADEAAQTMCRELDIPAHMDSLFGEFTPPINLDSWQQVLGVMARSGIHLPNSQDDTLKEYLEKHPECTSVQAWRDYKEHTKRASWDYPKYINSATGRVHTTYKQIGADTGRLSSKGPNLQNVPRESRIRRIFIPERGYSFICADYAQQEMRIMAEVSGDEALRAVCCQEDPHLANARMIWGRPDMEELVGEDRDTIKGTNFCMNYGGGVKTFSHSAGIPEAEGRRILAGLKAAYPKVFSWGANQRKVAQRQGYVETIWKRRRYFPGIDANPGMYPNEPLNTPIQGTAADMMKRAMVRLAGALKEYDAHLVLSIHDEVVVEAKEDQAEEVARIVEREMVAAGAEILKSVSCPAEAKIAQCWVH